MPYKLSLLKLWVLVADDEISIKIDINKKANSLCVCESVCVCVCVCVCILGTGTQNRKPQMLNAHFTDKTQCPQTWPE